MKISHLLRTLAVCLVLLALVQQTRAQNYNLLGPAWPAGSNVVMKLGLGPTPVALQDGSASWNASAAEALDIWNGYVDFITLSSIASATVPEISGDGVNATFFSSTIFGDTFGDDTLAVTVFLTDKSDTAIMTEADVVCNTAFRFDSYRGPLQSTAADIHRILLHEYGHALGLAHAGTSGGLVLMEPMISDVDHPFPDDVAGVRYLYGASFYYPPRDVMWPVGYLFADDLLPNNNPISFSATGLPPGIEINSATGRLDGTPTTSGVYSAIITAHGPIVDLSEGYKFTILGVEDLPGLLSIIPNGAYSMVADPIRPRIYVAGDDGISMIDADSFEVTNLIADGHGWLSISAGGSNLLVSYTDGLSGKETRFDLDSLQIASTLTIPAGRSPVLEGLNDQAYVEGPAKVIQFDANTGEREQTFAGINSYFGGIGSIAISPDRRTLFVAENGALSSYDISGASPSLVNSITGSFGFPVPSRDGQFLYYVTVNAGGDESVIQAHLPSLDPAAIITSSGHLGTAAVAPDGTVYQSISPDSNYPGDPSGFYSLFDPTTLERISNVELGNLQGEVNPYRPLGGVFESNGEHFFSIVNGFYGNEMWVFSTDLAAHPPPVDPTNNLLNISTRAHVETGENAMIGGFIIQGSAPKKVLVRGLGPSLPITGAMSNPMLELHDSTGKLIASNDNWISDQLNILGSLIPPTSERESAILMTLQPGAYTAIVHDVTNQPGLSLVEVYDLAAKDSLVANISTRGKVGTGDNAMIGGFIIGGEDATKVVIRAIGPSLGAQGIALPLADPVLEIHDSTGKLISTNDNWRSTQQNEIIATGIAPTNDNESAILLTLDPGSYTAIVRGQNNTTGVALVEVYNLDADGTGLK